MGTKSAPDGGQSRGLRVHPGGLPRCWQHSKCNLSPSSKLILWLWVRGRWRWPLAAARAVSLPPSIPTLGFPLAGWQTGYDGGRALGKAARPWVRSWKSPHICSWKCGLCTPTPIKSQRQRVLRKRKNSFCFARQRKTQQANASKLCPVLRGDSEGFYRFSSEDRLLIRCLYYSPSTDHFRVIKSSFSGSSDGFWLSLGLSFLDLLSGMKMA